MYLCSGEEGAFAKWVKPRRRARFTTRTIFTGATTVKSEMIEEILCVARRQIRSIVSLCEEFGDRRKVQNLPIRTIFERKDVKQLNNYNYGF